MTPAERIAAIRARLEAAATTQPSIIEITPAFAREIALCLRDAERYESALREAHAWSLAHGETAIPPAQAHKIRRCIEGALADDEATD